MDTFLSYNPIFEKEHYIDGQHNGGVFDNKNLNVYGYCYQNPVRYVDPNGKQNIAPLLANEETQTISVRNYIKFSKSQKEVLSRGCIGITALNLGTFSNPPLNNAYESFELAQEMAGEMTQEIKQNPQNYPENSRVVIYSKRFWSDNVNDFLPDENGFVDMTGYDYSPRPPYDYNNDGTMDYFTNFDYGFYDENRDTCVSYPKNVTD